VGPDPQTKEGSLTIGGTLRLGQFATAPSGTEGALYFNTTDKKTKVYSNAVWGDLGGGAVPGLLPNYTTAQRDALSPTTGQQIYNTTENKVQVYGSGVWIAVSAKLTLASTCTLDGDCDSANCVDGVCCNTVCSGTVCQTCGLLSSAGKGYCGYVNNSSQDPRNTCTTASVPNADSCKGPNCSGTAYSCGYLSGEASQPTCKTCTGSSYNPANIANASQDAQGTNLCTATHYRCDGNGNCTAPPSTTTTCVGKGNNSWCTAVCGQIYGYPGCKYNCTTCTTECTACNTVSTPYLYCQCYNWLY